MSGQFLLLPRGAFYAGGVCSGVSVSSKEERQADGAEQLDDHREKVETLVCPRQNCCKQKDKHSITLFILQLRYFPSFCHFMLMEEWKGDKKVLWKLVRFKPVSLT